MDKSKAKKVALRLGLALVVFGMLGSALYVFATLNYTYSSGDRVGFVEKLSTKGWVCKTNEGELAMVNLPGQPAVRFSFTVRDDKVVKEIEALHGHKIALTYEEHRGIPSSCFGDTTYFVTGVRKLD